MAFVGPLPLGFRVRLQWVVSGLHLSPLQPGRPSILGGPGIPWLCCRVAERMVVTAGWEAAAARSPQCGVFPAPAGAVLTVGVGSSCKDILVRLLPLMLLGGCPGGPRAHNSRSPPAPSEAGAIYSSQRPPEGGAVRQAP